MRQFAFVVLVVLLSMITSASHARKPKVVVEAVEDYVNKTLPEAGTVWHCWYDGGDSILCRLGEFEREAARGYAALPPPPVDSRLPDLVRKVWHQAHHLAGKIITIPLHTIPFDMALTGELAQAVMCRGASQACGVIFARNATLLTGLVDDRSRQIAAVQAQQLALND